MYRQFLLILLVALYVVQAEVAQADHHKAKKVDAENEKVNEKQERELERDINEDADDDEDLFEDDEDVNAIEDDAVFVDDDILDNLKEFKSDCNTFRRPKDQTGSPSSDRKCRRFYKGHWQAPPCDAGENQVGSRNHGAEVCCSPCGQCDWCTHKNGICTYAWRCNANFNKGACVGKCGCCFQKPGVA